MNRPAAFIASLLSGIVLTLASCSSQDNSDAITYDVTADYASEATTPSSSNLSPAPSRHSAPSSRAAHQLSDDYSSDSEPYRLGRTHARQLLSNCHTSDQIRDELLDINARVTNIKYRVGESAANDYLHGLHDELAASSDSLANTLF